MSTKEVLLPELAESVVEGEILKWLVQEGTEVTLEQPIVEVMTDKVTVELPSPFAGTLTRQLAKEGEVVGVHKPIALIEELGTPKNTAALETKSTQSAQKDSGDDLSLFKSFGEEEQIRLNPIAIKTASTHSHARTPAVPAARQLAKELGIDLSAIAGSGTQGRVEVLDVHRHAVSSIPTSPTHAPSHFPQPVQYKTPKGYEALEHRTPLRGMRRAISNQMLASHLYTVRTLTVDEVNLTQLVDVRNRLKAQIEKAGIKLSYLPFIFKAIACALKKYPSLNTSLDESTGEIVFKQYCNLGMAVATDAGLMVPVIRDVVGKSLLDLAQEINRLAQAAQSGKLTPDDMAGSTFSVTNIGSIGAQFSFPIINVPDAAILGIHSITKRPIVDAEDNIVIAHMMYLSLSFDHRLVDGAEAARFCKEVIRLLESPELLLLEAT
ncbi:MAG: dihydrolipoamide acetyltransferase family protein [Deinococcaceae bacterium]